MITEESRQIGKMEKTKRVAERASRITRPLGQIQGELLRYFPRYQFEKLEQQYQSNHYTKYYTGWHQFVTLLFAQIGGHNSLRGIEISLSGITSGCKISREVRCRMR
jgi:hypothetical protein